MKRSQKKEKDEQGESKKKTRRDYALCVCCAGVERLSPTKSWLLNREFIGFTLNLVLLGSKSVVVLQFST
jgi:hypothetical protein